jgi:beta-mannosidase
MYKLSLDGSWSLRPASKVSPVDFVDKRIPAHVPGDVMSALLAAKRIPDPYYREHETDLQWVGEADWQYSKDFTVSAGLLREERILLQCDGLDTLATIVLNGKMVARTDNMHRQYEWDVKPFLKAGRNTIDITFASANAYTRKRYPENPIRLSIGQGIRVCTRAGCARRPVISAGIGARSW